MTRSARVGLALLVLGLLLAFASCAWVAKRLVSDEGNGPRGLPGHVR